MNGMLRNSSIIYNSSKIFADILLQKIFLACVLLSLSVFTILGNLLVLYAIRTEKCLRTVSNLFILTLAFADLVVGFIVMPLSAANIVAGEWPFSYVICQMWLSIDYVASTASIFNLVLLSLDRYWAVVHPLLYLQTRTRKRATHFISLVWFVSLLWAPAIIFWPYIIPQHSDKIKPNECDTSFRSNKLFKTLTALVNFYVPLLTMIIISCRIMVAIRSRSTMEFGRRISLRTQRKMRENKRLISNDKDYSKRLSSTETNGQIIGVTMIINPFETNIENPNIPLNHSDENTDLSNPNDDDDDDENDSLWQFEIDEQKTLPLSTMKILFPSLTPSLSNHKRNSEDLSKTNTDQKLMRNSLSISKDMKYFDDINYQQNQVSKPLLTVATDDESTTKTIPINPPERQTSPPKEKLSISLSLPLQNHIERGSIITNNRLSSFEANSNSMTTLTFFDHIMNPSRSSSLKKELKAAKQLGMLVGVFTITWLPYFILFLVVAWCYQCVSDKVYTASIWLGYFNSTLNPLIYSLCNKHFRSAFRRILYCHHAKTKLPNLNSLKEFHSIRSIRHRR